MRLGKGVGVGVKVTCASEMRFMPRLTQPTCPGPSCSTSCKPRGRIRDTRCVVKRFDEDAESSGSPTW